MYSFLTSTSQQIVISASTRGNMGIPSEQASNALLYCTYAAFLVFGLFIAWRLRGQSAGEWLSANRTQTGIPLALNFIAAGECSRRVARPV
ncbi:uncharacterized protein RCC_05913 [Ramularia collo-cygni]|uniref:Uncharacterized protein n=1 Tax=Ramularia collo-cygni TaxID=112498 RepID=A0A2D3V8W7_9PEZI|nr:uncharacterized protein RCC_05913 [Ramularia collo-cygni]CZT20056.1 uncharacterized protein RCC_05913 [Ramularia collo-cygni]